MTQPTITVSLGRLTGWTLGTVGKSELGTTTTLATYTYTPITSRVIDFSIRRGRQHELDRIETGTASLTLLNQDGAFTPSNTSSVYYPDIRPMVPIKITATFDPFPSSIAGLVSRYDYSDATTLFTDTGRTTPVVSDGDAIKGVTDKSGNNKHLSSAAGAVYKVNIVNGLSVARFIVNNNLIADSALSQSQPTTIFVIHGNTSATAVQMNIINATDANENDLFILNATSVASIYAGGTVSSGTAVDDDAERIWVATFNGASSKLYLNGGSATTGNAGSNTIGTIKIGEGSAGSNDLQGDVGEILIYSGALSLTDINTIGAYLGTKWGITWTTAI